MTVDATAILAEYVFGEVFAWDLLVDQPRAAKNLTTPVRIAPSAIWAPIVQMQMADEHVIGIVTYRGCLRMTCIGYAPTADYLQAVLKALAAAAREQNPAL